ncbi:futalosine hydrolase [Streptomyces sp. NPDC020681]|uniref:futalosine hydrolase n=1 Tax=Streptomyces sp. NPDC020681 TaxID=3365083 RepID=UPI00378C311C
MRVLVVTAVAAEADSVAAGLRAFAGPGPGPGPGPGSLALPGGYTLTRFARTLPPALESDTLVDVLAAGVGPAAAAAATATALTTAPYDLVVSAGIGGGFQPNAPVGSVVVADAIVAADLGAQTPDGYLTVDELGFGRSVHLPPADLAARVAKTAQALYAPVLTVSTVTGTAERAAELSGRHPRAAAEAMEGFGVAEAAAAHGVHVLEIRAISNTVGPRDREAWRIGQALDSLRYAFQLLSPLFEESP